ncbi:MAG: PIN domain-containing protein [Verrucomicrobia bacterium]|nr:PIN domain-containing protein [Verrucomicrobiota bacterium]
MINAVLLDAGPWVAYLRRADQHHVWAREQFSAREEFVSCEAVLAEVCARLQYYGNDPLVALEFVKSGVVTLDFNLQSELISVENLMRKYRDQPMDLADACLVRMTEVEPRSLVVTTDEDFKFYRRNGREVVPHVLPE